MKASDLSRIKKFLASPEGRRLDKLSEAHLGPARSFENAKSRRAVAKLFISTLKESSGGKIDYRGFEKHFAEIAAEDAAQLNAAALEARAAAVKGSGSAQKLLDAETSSRLKGLNDLVALTPTVASPRYELLKAPFEIVPINLTLDAAESILVKSFVKFRVKLDRRGSNGSVQFNYLWQNLSDKFAVINVDGYMIFHGHAFVGVGGGVCPGNRTASYAVKGSLSLLQFWTQPPSQPFQQPDQLVDVSSLNVTADGFSEVGALDERDIFRGYDLRHTLLTVPPEGVVVIRLSATVNCSCGTDSGNLDVDFTSGEFNVGSPAVLVTILT